jgi:hypothetical protein
MIAELLEALTILCFGISWPVSIRKSLISRTSKGKSVAFEAFILAGYAFGIARKILQTAQGSRGFVFFLGFFFYVANFIAVAVDVVLYFRNRKLDRAAESAAQ